MTIITPESKSANTTNATATSDRSSKKQPLATVTPRTPSHAEISKWATSFVQKNSSSIKSNKKSQPTIVATTKSSSSTKKVKRPSTAVTSNVTAHNVKRVKNNTDDDIITLCGYHDEIDENNSGSSSRSSSSSSDSATNSTKKKKKNNNKKTLLPPSLLLSLSSSKPPLMSRYCGYCGDMLNLKVYGYDELNRNRRMIFHREAQESVSPQRRHLIQEAAESVKQRLIITTKTTTTTVATTTTTEEEEQEELLLLLKDLPRWPEESTKMDRTILEGLLSLKNTPKEEAICRCWLEPDIISWRQQQQDEPEPDMTLELKHDLAVAMTQFGKVQLSSSSLSSMKKKKKKTAATATATATTTKKKMKVIKKKNPTKTKINSGDIVSTKTVIVKCPKTGKKIKKTVRVVKKFIKKKKAVIAKTGANAHSTTVGVDVSGATVTAATKATKTTTSNTTNDNKKCSTKKKSTLLVDEENRGSADDNNNSSSKKRPRNSNGDDYEDGSFDDDDNDKDDGNDDDDDDDDDDMDENNHSPRNGISLKKRRRNDEKADLELRDKLMNAPLENGRMFPSQRELLELTTVRKRNALQTFFKRFNELRQFIVIFGDANVPQQFPENHSLGIWVNKMRMERKKWDKGSERTSLTERKIELLESIDFIWAQNHKGEIGWERRFQEIRKFKRKHGHCNVPTKSAENRALGRWVSTQRTMYKNYMKGFVGKSLTREEQERRIFLLLKEGFLFSMIPNGQNGEDNEESGDVTTENITEMADFIKTATNIAPKIATTTNTNERIATIISKSEGNHNNLNASSLDLKDSDDRPDVKSDQQNSSGDQKGVISSSSSSSLPTMVPPSNPTNEIPLAQVSTITASPPPTLSVSTTTSLEKIANAGGKGEDLVVNDDRDGNEDVKVEDVVANNGKESTKEKYEENSAGMKASGTATGLKSTTHTEEKGEPTASSVVDVHNATVAEHAGVRESAAPTSFISNDVPEKAKSSEKIQEREVSNETVTYNDETSSSAPFSEKYTKCEAAKDSDMNMKVESTNATETVSPTDKLTTEGDQQLNGFAAAAKEKSTMKVDATKVITKEETAKVTTEVKNVLNIKTKPAMVEIAKGFSSTKEVANVGGDSTLSPTRRSGRARKPSARQLAAEKQSPICESIKSR